MRKCGRQIWNPGIKFVGLSRNSPAPLNGRIQSKQIISMINIKKIYNRKNLSRLVFIYAIFFFMAVAPSFLSPH